LASEWSFADGGSYGGAVADMLLLHGDPFEDPSVLWNDEARTVVQAGAVL
jgi:hypothetical protein